MLGKKFYINYLFILILLISISRDSNAQDPQFSQFYANALYLNPGFTGNTTQLRFASTYRNQWPSIPGGFNSYTAAFDYNIEAAKSGVGFLATHDKSGSGGLRYTNIAGFYAAHLQLSRKLGLRPGLKLSYTLRDVDQSSLIFADQIARDGAPTSLENIQEGIGYVDLGFGAVLAHLEKYWLGFSLDHLNRPNYSLLGGESALPIKLSIHGGWNFEIDKPGSNYGTNTIRAIAHYKAQQDWDQFDIGGYYEAFPLVFGLWYRGIPGFKSYQPGYANNDAIVMLLGMKVNDLRIGYSYDLTISRLVSNTGGAHEISLIYEVASRRKKRSRKRFLVPCAKF
ncbi:MAG: PorP/SprF family type IX secretion system membrane protein [Vicingaceae bacterium]